MNKLKLSKPRIIAGKFKNFKLEVAASSRPVTERVKITLFDTIKDIINGSSILDLFAGSGSLGIEALSRGANLAIFNELNDEAFTLLKRNLQRLDLEKKTHKIYNLDYQSFCKLYKGNFNIIFLDPPFKIQSQLNLGLILDMLDKNGVIVYKVETNQVEDIKIPDSLALILEKKIGVNTLLFLQKHN